MVDSSTRNQNDLFEGSNNPTDAILDLVGVPRGFQVGGEVIHALRHVSLSVRRGEFMSIVGRSGSGKSTLLNVISCLDRPTAGSIVLDRLDVTLVPKGQLPKIRRDQIGFVFQSFNLIPTLTALENVILPMQYAGRPDQEYRRRALAALEAVRVSDRLGHRPSQLSGGQAHLFHPSDSLI